MNDAMKQRLIQAIKYQGISILLEPDTLQRLLSPGFGEPPSDVKALILLLDKKAVTFLTNWQKETSPDKPSYAEVRKHIATKFSAAGLLDEATAGWAMDSWAEALNVHKEPPPPTTLSLLPLELPPLPPGPAEAAAFKTATGAVVPPLPPKAIGPASSSNPYRPPSAYVDDVGEKTWTGGDDFIINGESRPLTHGWKWIGDAWKIFMASPFIWLVNMFLGFVLVVLISLVPFVGPLFVPVLYAGMLLGADAVQRGEPLSVGHVFAGFRERLGPLVLLGLLHIVLQLIVAGIFAAVLGFGFFLGVGKGLPNTHLGIGTIINLILLVVVVAIPTGMAIFYSTALVAVGGRKPVESMMMSFWGCLKNILPGIAFIVTVWLLLIIATVPMALGIAFLGPLALFLLVGYVVLLPVLGLSVYTSYHDIFHGDSKPLKRRI